MRAPEAQELLEDIEETTDDRELSSEDAHYAQMLDKIGSDTDEIGYDSTFFLMFLRGDKKVRSIYINLQLLPISMSGSFELNTFKKGITLSKDYIISRMVGNEVYGLYTPNDVQPKKLSRAFLLKVCYII